MARVFAYCRVSTEDQNAQNQVLEIAKRGFDIEPERIVSETISGSVQAMKRPKFKTLVEHSLEKGDSLIVLKLDRLGRDNIDVQQTISSLIERGIKVHSLDLASSDLASAEGKLMLQVFTAFAEFERSRIRERTREGLERAKANGVKLGRPKAEQTTSAVQAEKLKGLSQSKTAMTLGISLATVKRHWNI
jgi:putative DNA-invertase from lambdoid prophage Rac